MSTADSQDPVPGTPRTTVTPSAPGTPSVPQAARVGGAAKVALAAATVFFGGTLFAPVIGSVLVVLLFLAWFWAGYSMSRVGTYAQTPFATAASIAFWSVAAAAAYLYSLRGWSWLCMRKAAADGRPLPPASTPVRRPWLTLGKWCTALAWLATKIIPSTTGIGLRFCADIVLLAFVLCISIGATLTGVRWTWKGLRGLFRIGRASPYRAGFMTATMLFVGLTALAVPPLLLAMQNARDPQTPRDFGWLRRLDHALAMTGTPADAERRLLYRLSHLGADKDTSAGPSGGTRLDDSSNGDSRSPALAALFGNGGSGGDEIGGSGDGGSGGFNDCIQRLLSEENRVRRLVSFNFRRQLSDEDIIDTVRDALISVCLKNQTSSYDSVVAVFITSANRLLKDRVKGGFNFYETACDFTTPTVSCQMPVTTPEEVRLSREHQFVATLWCQLEIAEREVFAARYVDELSFAEIAAELGITERKARDLHSNTLKKLRRWWDEECADRP